MSDLQGATAAELARDLEIMEDFPHNTGGLSMLDEATLAFGSKYPDIGQAQRAFGNARYAHKRSYSTETQGYSDEAWATVMAAARTLAAALRPLGDARIARCERMTGWGTCNLPLDDNGTCRGTSHTDIWRAQGPRRCPMCDQPIVAAPESWCASVRRPPQ